MEPAVPAESADAGAPRTDVDAGISDASADASSSVAPAGDAGSPTGAATDAAVPEPWNVPLRQLQRVSSTAHKRP